jgi:hypothetical protein
MTEHKPTRRAFLEKSPARLATASVEGWAYPPGLQQSNSRGLEAELSPKLVYFRACWHARSAWVLSDIPTEANRIRLTSRPIGVICFYST